MRPSVLVALVLVLSCHIVHGADEPCHQYLRGPALVEWTENGELRGARLVSRVDGWEVGGGGLHANAFARCESCSGGLPSAMLWLSAGDERERDLDRKLAPRSVAAHIIGFPDLRAKTDPVSISFGGLEGRARVVTMHGHDRRVSDGIAVAAAKGCLSLFGILAKEPGGEMDIDQVARFDAAIGIEWYRPEHRPDAMKPPPAPREHGDLLLGDARKRAGQER
jgi:hypothetical protein